jgi:putative peptidoglycan lipid II flippase
MNLLRATATIGSLTLASRIAGFGRDILMARYLGAGMAADVFLIAFRLPNLFRSLFAEGAFSAAFVPMFNRQVGEDGGDTTRARRFAEDVLAVLLPVLLGFTLLMVIGAGPVVWALTGGFGEGDGGDGGKFALAVELTRLTFPYLMLISLVALLGGILNSLGRFWINAAAPILLNLTLMAALLWPGTGDGVLVARRLATAVSLAGIVQLLWLLWGCLRADVRLRLRAPQLTEKVRTLMRLILPAALGAGATQINLLVSTALAARFLPEGAVSWLYYADRINQLPLGIIGIGVGTALLPTLSRQIGAGELRSAQHSQNRAIELALLLALPAAAGLAVLSGPVIGGLFERGAFGAADTQATAAALAVFALGLPAYVLVKVLTPGFHARQDTRTPVRIAMAAILANLAGNLVLVWPLGHVGIAAATAGSAWLNAGLLWWLLVRRGLFALDAKLARALPRLGLAVAIMVAVLLGAGAALDALAPHRLVALGLLIGSGGLAYLAALHGLGVIGLGELKAALRRGRGSA